MDVLEKISEVMQQHEMMKKGFSESLLVLMLNWRSFEQESELSAKCLLQCFNEMEAREKHLRSVQESVVESSKELDLIRESVEERWKEVERKERDFCAFREREIKDLECKWDELVLAKKGFDEVVKLREEKLNEQDKMGKLLLEEIEFEHKQLEKEFEERSRKLNEIQSRICEESEALHLKDRKFAEQVEEFQVKETNIQSMEKELEEKVRSLNSVREELTVKENRLDTLKRELKEKEHKLDSIQKEVREKETTLDSATNELHKKVNNLDSLKKQLDIKQDYQTLMKNELELKQKNLDTIIRKLELQEQNLVSESMHRCDDEFLLEKENFQTEQGLLKKRVNDIVIKEKQVEMKFRELEQREKHIESRFKELDEKEKQLKMICNASVKTEPIDYVEVDKAGVITSDSADIRLFVTMDGKSLQIYLNEREKERDMSDEIFKALHLSRNPGKLVLDAMEGFYPPHLMKGDTEFNGDVAKQTCILLLEQLIRFSPKIQPIVRKRAMKLASEWKAKLRAGNQVEILGFLYLLASYSLVSAFDVDELMNMLAVVAEHNKSMELRRLLGFTEKIPCFIHNLITKQKHLEAIKFAYAFELVNDFPPIPLLKDYLKQVMQISEGVCNRETCSVKEMNEAIEQSIHSIKAVIRCIMDHELQSQYRLKPLEECIESLMRQKADITTSSVISEADKPQQTQMKQMASARPSGPADANALSSTSFSGRPSSCMLGHSDAMAAIIGNMGGKNLLSFLINHREQQELMRIEIYRALKMSSDAGLLVLEAIEGFYPPKPQYAEISFDPCVIRKSCILLLEELMRLSPEIKLEVKLEAQKLASDWRAKMMAEAEDHLAILGFLLLVGTYRLASAFNKNELECLCHDVAKEENASEICHILSISGEHPLIEKYLYPSKIEPLCNKLEMKGKGCDFTSVFSSSFIHCASDPAKVVLDALRKCRSANLGKNKYKSIMKKFPELLEQLREVSPEITPQVKVEATVLADKWRETLTGPQPNHPEVLGFLHLLATFELSSLYDSDELVGLLEVVYQSKRAIILFKIFGLEEKIPGFIQNMIRRKERLLAIQYVYEYELVGLFPPATLLKDHVRHSEELATKIRDNRLHSPEAQEKAINCELLALRDAVKYIEMYNLQSEYSPDHLRARIVKLQKQMEDLRIPNQHSNCTAKSQGDDRDEVTLCALVSQVQKTVTKKRPASDTEGVTVLRESQQKLQKLQRVCESPMRIEVGPDAIIGNASLPSEVGPDAIIGNASLPSAQHTSSDPQICTVPPNYSEEVLSQSLAGCPADDQIFDPASVHSGQASSQLIVGPHPSNGAPVLESGEPISPVQASSHAAVTGKITSRTGHSDHSVIASSMARPLLPQIYQFDYHTQDLMPKLEELLSKLQNSLSSSGKTETPSCLT